MISINGFLKWCSSNIRKKLIIFDTLQMNFITLYVLKIKICYLKVLLFENTY